MQNFMITLLTCSAVMSALVLLYTAVTPLLAKRYSAKGRYYAWLIIVIGLIIPFRPQFSSSIVNITPTNTTIPIIQIGNGVPIISPTEKTIAPAVLVKFSLWQIVMVIWLIGVITFLAYHLIKHYRFIAIAKRWSEPITNKQVRCQLERLKAELGILGKISLHYCLSIGSPMLIGFVHPRILLPQTDFDRDELYLILKHELVHYKRKDLWYRFLVLLATALHWFNPFVSLMAREIDTLCEMSCDAEVVRDTNMVIRQHYSKAIIGVAQYQSKMKTALSTNFYGGIKGMKKRILTIMDMSNKKAGLAVLCSVLILCLGTGFAFSSNAETQSPPEIIKEDIVISPQSSYAYKFLPDPAIYAKYSSYGINISDDGELLLYDDQRVRLFVDEYSDAEAFYFDEAGAINLTVIRNAAGNITGIKSISEDKAQKYCSAFFADDLSVTTNPQDTTDNKYKQYSAYGITLSAGSDVLYYNGQPVKLFADKLPNGSFEAFWFDEAGTVNLSVVRNENGQVTAIENISEKRAQQYRSSADEYEQNVLNGLDEKVAAKMDELYQ